MLKTKISRLGLLSEPVVNLPDRDMTYVKSYDHLIEHFAKMSPPTESEFTALAHAAFGWMPTILDLKIENWADVRRKLGKLGEAPLRLPDWGLREVRELSECISTRASNGKSVVGLSKILHFLYPAIWPIWDKRTGTTWGGFYRKDKCGSYCEYAYALREVVTEGLATEVNKTMNKNLNERGLPPVGALRALEMTLFIKGRK